MSTAKGKRYEREVARDLREHGWTVERVTGSGGFSGTGDCDLVMLPPPVEPDEDCPLVDHPKVMAAEVKYDSDASGFVTAYDVHGLRYGLGVDSVTVWSDGVSTTGIKGLSMHFSGVELHTDGVQSNAPAKIAGWLDGKSARQSPDIVLCRGARREWVAAFRNDGGKQ